MSDLSKLSNAEFMERLLSAAAIADTLMAGGGVLLREAASRLQAPAVAEVKAFNARISRAQVVNDPEYHGVEIVMLVPEDRIDELPAAYRASARSALRTGGSE